MSVLSNTTNPKPSQFQKLKPYKWLIVVLNSFSLFASMYATQDLSTQQINYKYHFRNTQNFEMYFNLMYMLSFVVLMTSNLFLGKLCDRYRPGFFVMGAAFFAFIGQFSILAAVRMEVLGLLFAGKLLINLASTPLLMGNGKMMANVFDKGMLATANSICIMVNLMGTFVNLRFSGIISQNYGFLGSLLFCQGLTFIAALFSLIVCGLDVKFSKTSNAENNNNIGYQQESLQNLEIKVIKNNIPSLQNIEEQAKDKNTWREFLTTASLPFFLFAFGQGTLNLCANIVEIIGPRFLYDEYHLSPTNAGTYMSIIPMTPLLMPIFSRLIDMFGKPMLWIIPSAIFGAIGVFGLTLELSPMIFLFIFGISFSLKWVSIFPGIEELCDRDHSGKAFAFIRVTRDLMGIGLTLLNGFLYERYQSYMASMYLLIVLQVIALIAGILAFVNKYKEYRKDSISSDLNTSIRTTDTLP